MEHLEYFPFGETWLKMKQNEPMNRFKQKMLEATGKQDTPEGRAVFGYKGWYTDGMEKGQKAINIYNNN
ncbi:MAG: hypothetical protein OEV94_02355 [Deltaproteobacteria bacterium]|nr:hypothetical protein [Deltaproteobacteria bacterium]